MTQMVTRCPKCATAFRITSTQLESAKGSVRCGSCLHIFKAQEYLVKTVTPPNNTNTTSVSLQSTATKEAPKNSISNNPVASAPKTIIDKGKVLADEDDELISDDMDAPTQKESSYEFDGFIDAKTLPKQTVSLFEREVRFDTPDENDKERIDESWAEELLAEDDNDDQRYFVRTSPRSSNEENNRADEPSDYSEPIFEHDAPAITSAPEPLFSFVSESSPNDSEKETEFSEEFLDATRGNSTPAPSAEVAAFSESLFTENTEPEEQTPSKPSVKKTPKIRGLEVSRASLLMNIIPAPVEFTARRMRRWYQQKIWPLAALIALTALFFQVAYFKFDYFSRVEPYRTGYLFACPIFHCTVPTLVNTKLIQANSLVVRAHPDIKNALIVDAILLNVAEFEQPFPDLIMSFSSIDDKPVAARRFTPKEYLAGELVGMTHMPSQQPVHITLELVDPGKDADNYHMIIP